MAIVLDEFRLLPESVSPPEAIADDGAPLHSRFLHDAPRNKNNLGTVVEPCFQFCMSAGHALGYVGGPTLRYFRPTTDFPAGGRAFIAQVPVLLPHQAKRLRWTMDIEIGNTGPETDPIIEYRGVTMYLVSNPITPALINYPTTNPGHTHEAMGVITEADVKGRGNAYITHGAGGVMIGTHILVEDVTTGWENFMRGGHVSMAFGAPMSWLVISFDFLSAAINDFIIMREFSLWGAYE